MLRFTKKILYANCWPSSRLVYEKAISLIVLRFTVGTMASEGMDCSSSGQNFTSMRYAACNEVFLACIYRDPLSVDEERIAMRFQRHMLDTQRMQDFAQWRKTDKPCNWQATEKGKINEPHSCLLRVARQIPARNPQELTVFGISPQPIHSPNPNFSAISILFCLAYLLTPGWRIQELK
jgi:hypothetical protein